MTGEQEPWLIDDVWSAQYEDDVDRLRRVGRGVGLSFVLFALLLLIGLVAFFVFDGPQSVVRWVLRGAGGE